MATLNGPLVPQVRRKRQQDEHGKLCSCHRRHLQHCRSASIEYRSTTEQGSIQFSTGSYVGSLPTAHTSLKHATMHASPPYKQDTQNGFAHMCVLGGYPCNGAMPMERETLSLGIETYKTTLRTDFGRKNRTSIMYQHPRTGSEDTRTPFKRDQSCVPHHRPDHLCHRSSCCVPKEDARTLRCRYTHDGNLLGHNVLVTTAGTLVHCSQCDLACLQQPV